MLQPLQTLIGLHEQPIKRSDFIIMIFIIIIIIFFFYFPRPGMNDRLLFSGIGGQSNGTKTPVVDLTLITPGSALLWTFVVPWSVLN